MFYPLILHFVWREKENDFQRFSIKDKDLPTVHILMAAYNEEAVITQKIESVLLSNYPKQKLYFHIGSDASTDKTDALVKAFQQKNPQINLTVFGGRCGKPHIINSLAEQVKNLASFTQKDVFIITDANVLFKPETVYELVAYFKTEGIGMVGTVVENTTHTGTNISLLEQVYINGENNLKIQESKKLNAVIGVFGGCLAVKPNSFNPTPKGFIADDFFTTMDVINQGKKVIIAPNALVTEDLPDSFIAEFKRKRRISAGNFQNMKYFKKLWFLPTNKLKLAFFSHKILRWLGPVLLLLIFVSSFLLALLSTNAFYILVSFGFLVLFILMLLKKLSPHSIIFKIKVVNAITYFLLMNLALLLGLTDFLKGIETNTWERTERNI